MENTKNLQPSLEPVESRKLNRVSPRFIQAIFLWQVSMLLLQTILGSFSPKSRSIILQRAQNRSGLSGRRPTMANKMHAAHQTRTQWLVKDHPDYNNPDYGIALLESEHAKQHIELAEVAQTLGDVWRNVEAAELVLRRWKTDVWQAIQKYGPDTPITLLPEWQPLIEEPKK